MNTSVTTTLLQQTTESQIATESTLETTTAVDEATNKIVTTTIQELLKSTVEETTEKIISESTQFLEETTKETSRFPTPQVLESTIDEVTKGIVRTSTEFLETTAASTDEITKETSRFPTQQFLESTIDEITKGIIKNSTDFLETTAASPDEITKKILTTSTEEILERVTSTVDEIAQILNNNTSTFPDVSNTNFTSNFSLLATTEYSNTTTEASSFWPTDQQWLYLLMGAGGFVVFLGICAMILIWKLCDKKRPQSAAKPPTCKVIPCGKKNDTASTAAVKKNSENSPLPGQVHQHKPPLPPIGTSQSIRDGEVDGYQGNYVPPRRLAPIERVANIESQGSGRETYPKYGLKGIPMIHVPTDKLRPLPPLDG